MEVFSLFSQAQCYFGLRVLVSGARMQGSYHRNRGFGGFYSFSDGKQFFGVRNRGLTLEIKNWYEGVGFCKDVKLSLEEAAIAHDLARVYADPTVDEKRLNTPKIGFRMQEEYPALAGSGQPLNIGKNFLIHFVDKHPLKRVGREWVESMKGEIIGLAPAALKGLKEWIAREHSSRAGRQRKDLDVIHPVVQEGDLLEMSKEIQHLKATIHAQNATINAQNATINAQYATISAQNAALEKKDAALKEKDAGMTSIKDMLYAANELAAMVTPFKRGFAQREEFHQNESNPASGPWMEFMDWTMIDSHLPTD